MQQLLPVMAGTFLGTLGFALLLNAPKISVLIGSLLGALGYGIYYLLLQNGWRDPMAMFVGMVVGSLLAQAAARRMKMIATIFLTMVVIPGVPGLGLYRCMELLARGDTGLGMRVGIGAMSSIVMIALAFVLSGYATRVLHPKKKWWIPPRRQEEKQ